MKFKNCRTFIQIVLRFIAYQNKRVRGLTAAALLVAIVAGCSSKSSFQGTIDSNSAAGVPPTPTPIPTPTPSPSQSPSALIVVGNPNGTVALTPGMTFGNVTLDPTGDTTAVGAGKQLLENLFQFQNQWSGGFGVDSDIQWPSQTSAYDWTELQARISLIQSTGGTPVITLCGVPKWMRVTPAVYWSAPQAAYFQAYANYAAAVATQFPQVKYFLVWSELKGFWNASLNRWDYEGYTQFYNGIYTALKAVSPNIKVGGPYMNMTNFYGTGSGGSSLTGAYGTVKQNALDVVTYWLANNKGADFIVVDGSVSGNSNTQAPADWYAANQYFSDVDNWLQTAMASAKVNLPIWWSEYYPNPCLYDQCNPYVAIFNHDQQNTLLSKTLLSMMSKVAVALKWTPDGENIDTSTTPPTPAPYQSTTGPLAGMGDQSSVWSDTSVPGGGQAFPFAGSLASFEQCFTPGSTLYSTQVSTSNVSAYANSKCVAVINQTSQNQTVQITFASSSTQIVQLSPYQVYYANVQ